MMSNRLKQIYKLLGSIELGLISFVMLFVLTFFCTLSEVDYGVYASVQRFFNSYWIYVDIYGIQLPIFPGGITVGIIMGLNVLIAIVLKNFLKKPGLYLTHIGILMIIFSAGLTNVFSTESQCVLEEGETKYSATDFHYTEIIVLESQSAVSDRVTSFETRKIKSGMQLSDSSIPFIIRIKAIYKNSRLIPADRPDFFGIGKKVKPQEIPVFRDDQARNIVSATVELLDLKGNSLGNYEISSAIQAHQRFQVAGKTYHLALRYIEHYFPFAIRLEDFDRQVYAGTVTPRSFQSKVEVIDIMTQDSILKATIRMNRPLRYQGFTFFQASFADNDTVSILQVVRNVNWMLPYFGSAVTMIGLIWHCAGYWVQRRRRKAS